MLPVPITELTLTQSFELRKISDQIDKIGPENIEDLKTMTKELVKHNLVLRSNVSHLVRKSTF